MEQAVDSPAEGDKGSEGGQAGDLPDVAGPRRETVDGGFPRIREGLLEAEGEAPVRPVEARDRDLDLLSHREHALDILHPLPPDLRNGDQPLDRSDGDEGTELPDRGDGPLHHHSLRERRHHLPRFPLLLFFQQGPAGDDDVAAVLPVLRDPERGVLPDALLPSPGPRKVHLRVGAERPRSAREADFVSPLDLLHHDPVHGDPRVRGVLELRRPGRPPGDAGGEEHLAAVRGDEVRFEGVPLLDGDGPRLVLQLLGREDALPLPAQIEEHPLRGHLDDPGGYLLPGLVPRRGDEAPVEHLPETLLFRFPRRSRLLLVRLHVSPPSCFFRRFRA